MALSVQSWEIRSEQLKPLLPGSQWNPLWTPPHCLHGQTQTLKQADVEISLHINHSHCFKRVATASDRPFTRCQNCSLVFKLPERHIPSCSGEKSYGCSATLAMEGELAVSEESLRLVKLASLQDRERPSQSNHSTGRHWQVLLKPSALSQIEKLLSSVSRLQPALLWRQGLGGRTGW